MDGGIEAAERQVIRLVEQKQGLPLTVHIRQQESREIR